MSYDATPLTREQILEHALRSLIKQGDLRSLTEDVAYDLDTGNVSVLDMRAAELLRRIAVDTLAFNEERER